MVSGKWGFKLLGKDKSINGGHKVHWNYNCKPGHYRGFMGGGEGELILEAGWQKLREGTKVFR